MMLAIICIIGLLIAITYGAFRIIQIVKQDNAKFDAEIKENNSSIYEDCIKKHREVQNNWSYTETRYEFEMPEYDRGKPLFKKTKKSNKPLEEQLKDAVESEDYETAARIRDEIKSKK